MESVIKYCTECAKKQIEHTYQDTQYGKYNRIMNPLLKGGVFKDSYKCTVCGTIDKYTTKSK